MVTGLWNKVKIYCDLHEELVEMTLSQKNGVVYYACALGNSENEKDHGVLCKSTLSLKDFEKMLDHISTVMCDAIKNNEEPNLKNTQFTLGKIKYKIFEHKDIIKIRVRDVRLGK